MNTHLNNLLLKWPLPHRYLGKTQNWGYSCICPTQPQFSLCLDILWVKPWGKKKHSKAKETEMPAKIWGCLAGLRYILKDAFGHGTLGGLYSLLRKPGMRMGMEEHGLCWLLSVLSSLGNLFWLALAASDVQCKLQRSDSYARTERAN